MQICIVQDISFDVLYNMYVLIREYLISMEQGLKGLKYLSIKGIRRIHSIVRIYLMPDRLIKAIKADWTSIIKQLFI